VGDGLQLLWSHRPWLGLTQNFDDGICPLSPRATVPKGPLSLGIAALGDSDLQS